MVRMSRDRWRVLSRYLDQALDLEHTQRMSWLESLGSEDPSLALDLAALLAEHEKLDARGYLEQGLADAWIDPLAVTAERPSAKDRPRNEQADDSFEELLRIGLHPGPFGADLLPGQMLAGERFRIVRKLGSGGMGVVFEALELESGGRVALKVLPVLEPQALLRFKNEFRLLRDIRHPNLVLLRELIEEQQRWFISMEVIDGPDFLSYVRRSSVVDAGRLTSALQQLAQVLEAVHAARRVHRDVKPSNILVTREGRVVLLDFGIAAQIKAVDRWTDAGGAVGTFAYMAPEQVSAEAVGPAADWYSVGVLLYQALDGQLPFQGSMLDILDAKRRGAPPPPRSTLPAAPVDLPRLCVDLLHPDPLQRPSGAEVLERLASRTTPAHSAVTERAGAAQSAPFVGRNSELEWLQASFDATRLGSGVTLLVQGESGVGKSALLDHFAEALRDRDATAVVLTGRCYERESVPYRALDGVVDSLSRWMSRIPESEAALLVPANAALLGEVFPVLRKAEPFARVPLPRHRVVDPQERRTRVFGALRELLFRLAERRPTLVAIDDLQWSDPDSLALLREILRPPEAPALLLAATVRAPAPDFALPGDVREIELGRLHAREAQQLALALLGTPSAPAAGTLAEEARGHPLFIHALARHTRMHGQAIGPALQLDDALRAQVAGFDAAARRLVEVVAIAGAPITLVEAAQAAQIGLPELDRLVSTLAAASLVRTTGLRNLDLIEPYHDRVREAVAASVEPAARRELHERLALTLTATGAPFETLALHWRGAGDSAQAASYAVLAAEDAMRALAFERAARLYRWALELGSPRQQALAELQAKLGEALANAGRGAEAAEAYLAAARVAEQADARPTEVLVLRRRGAEELLRSGRFDRGLETLRRVLAATGIQVARTSVSALLSILVRRAILRLRGLQFVERTAQAVPPSELARADACWAGAMGLAVNDFIRGMDLQTRHLLLSLRAGEPSRVVRAIALETCYTATHGWSARRRTAQLLTRTRQLAARFDQPQALAWVSFSEGATSWLEGRFKSGLAGCDGAERAFRDGCTGVAWELSTAQLFAHWCLWALGEYGELSRRVALQVREAEERGDLYAVSTLRAGLPNVIWLAADEPARALEETEIAIQGWSSQGFHLQHFWDMLARAEIGLYAGNGRTAFAHFMQSWPALVRSLLLRPQVNLVISFSQRGRCALAAAAESQGKERERLAREAERCAQRLERQGVAYASALARPLRAGVAAIRGESARAAGLYELAAGALDAVDMSLHAAVARRRRGELLGGDEGSALVAAADELARGRGIVRPERIAALLMP